MPSLKRHLENSQKRTGKEHPVHLWLDGPEVPYLERLRRHNPCRMEENAEKVRAIFGEEGVNEFMEHMREDWPRWLLKICH